METLGSSHMCMVVDQLLCHSKGSYAAEKLFFSIFGAGFMLSKHNYIWYNIVIYLFISGLVLIQLNLCSWTSYIIIAAQHSSLA